MTIDDVYDEILAMRSALHFLRANLALIDFQMTEIQRRIDEHLKLKEAATCPNPKQP
jgi:hypothetical protein